VSHAKAQGQFFTPTPIARTLVRWALRSESDRILDPSCGDGEFLCCHDYAVGCELDPQHAATARKRAPAALVHGGDFFTWADETQERFEAIVGNPPFIRYQGFAGSIRERALRQAKNFGANLSGLTSSWAPFIAASAQLLKIGGRAAFIVPAEIGHASYAVPLIEALCRSFGAVTIVAIREKIFPSLSEDAWILYATDYGDSCDGIQLIQWDRFLAGEPAPYGGTHVSLDRLRNVRGRIRRWLLPKEILNIYESFEDSDTVERLGSLASVSIGYVSGANDFFHLRPSDARRAKIDAHFLQPAVRRGASLPPAKSLVNSQVQKWLANDDPVLLLRLDKSETTLPVAVRRYLDSAAGIEARKSYKCRARDPWYAVPDVTIPDGFLTVMSGKSPQIIRNSAYCAGTNSVHVVKAKKPGSFRAIQERFATDLTRLSCELEGHPLGGGMLKLEPREAQRLLLPGTDALAEVENAREALLHGIRIMRNWRGCA